MFARYLLFFALLLAAFGPLWGSPFLYDDVRIVEDNQLLRSADGLQEIWSGHVDDEHEMDGSYRPLFLTFFFFLGKLFGFHPAPFRLLSFALHALNAVLLFWLARRFFSISVKWAWLAALIFLLHPIQITSLAIVWKQSDLWIGLSMLLTVWTLSKHAHEKEAKSLVFAVALFPISLLIKESALVLPVLWFALEPILSKQGRGKRLATAAVLLVLALAYYKKIHPVIPRTHADDANPYSHFQYFMTQLSVLPMYLRNLLWPTSLTIDRAVPTVLSMTPGILIKLLLLLGSAVAALYFAVRQQSKVAFLYLLSLLWLVPTSSVHKLSLVYDETRFYLVTGAFGLWLAWSGQHYVKIPPALSRMHKILLGALALMLGMISFSETARWSSEVALWSSAIEVDPRSARAHYQLAYNADRSRAWDDAENHYREALRLSPDLYAARLNLGVLRGQRGDLNQSARHFRQLLSAPPRWKALAYYHLALDALYRNRPNESFSLLESAQKAYPKGGLAHKGRALVHTELGNPSEAIESWKQYLATPNLTRKEREIATRRIGLLAAPQKVR